MTPKKKTSAKGKTSGFKKKPALQKPSAARKPVRVAAKKPEASASAGEGEEPELEEELEQAVVTRHPGRAAAVEIEARVKARKESPETPAEEVSTEELWTLYRKEVAKRGIKDPKRLDELRNHLIERHYPLVRYIAERLLQTLPKSIELDDLVSAGLFGLMDAIRGFDASRGIKFKTYCSTRIRGAILDQLRSQDWVPRLVRLKASRIDRALQRLTAEYGREPTHAELARVLEMEHGDLVNEIQESRAKTMFSLSEKWEDDDGAVEKVEILEDKTATDPVFEMNRRDLMNFITRALTHKERFIIEQYYQYGHTMREIGEMLALTESRVCQIHSNVMSRLKGLLGQRHESLLS
jgi:RNA polymerase sigma factor for flagellar operon FliA